MFIFPGSRTANPIHSMGLPYVPTLGWFEGSIDRHIWQSHGVYGNDLTT